MEERKVTLTELLDSREQRVSHQRELLERYGGVLICTTLNIPGPVKDKPSYRAAMEAAVAQLTEKLTETLPEKLGRGTAEDRAAPEPAGGAKTAERAAAQILHCEIRHLPTGPEGYVVCAGEGTGKCAGGLSLEAVKRLTVEIEEASPLGRLFDMDVLAVKDEALVGISRKDIGYGRRTCLLCGGDAKVCARSQKHDMGQLLAEIDRILDEAGVEGSKIGREAAI